MSSVHEDDGDEVLEPQSADVPDTGTSADDPEEGGGRR